MAWSSGFHGAAALAAASPAAAVLVALAFGGCAAPESLAGWFESADHEARGDFPAAAGILEGFDESRPNDAFERGDRALYGVRLGDEDFLVLLEVGGTAKEPWSSVINGLAAESSGDGDRPVLGIQFEEPRSRELVVTAFDGTGARISRETLVVAPALFHAGLAAGCASYGDYEMEQSEQRLGAAARRVLTGWAACHEFLSVVQNSDTLRPLLEKAVAVNLWSVIRSFSAKVSVRHRTSEAVRHGDGYRFPLTILVNDEPALDCSVVVTEPRSPLNVGAGVLSIVGIRPGDREPAVTLRLLAARRGR